MKQPARNTSKSTATKPKKTSKKRVVKPRTHPKYGTSKLEEDFAREFLDKLGVEYVYQFEAKDIGRFYDFYLPRHNLLIEIDGDYWHGNPDIYEEKDLRYHQKKQQRVDEYKTRWALLHSIPIMHIWEHDIRKESQKVMKLLKERLNIEQSKQNIIENKKKRHVNRLNIRKKL